MRALLGRSGAALAGFTAVMLTAGGATVAGASTAAEPADVTLNVASDDLTYADDAGGCGITEHRWELCVYFQHGVQSYARVVPDSSESANGDGALRLVTPNAGDKVDLQYFGYDDGHTFPRFDELDGGRISINVRTGAAPDFSLYIECPSEDDPVTTIAYAGPRPEVGSGWRTVDLVMGGEALWVGGYVQFPRPLSDHQAACPGGLIKGHNLRLEVEGADVRVDDLELGNHEVNFRIPTLTREAGFHPRRKMPTAAEAQRLRAEAVGKRQFQDVFSRGANVGDDGWTYPARPRLPRARAAVIAPQGHPANILVGAALATAVRGPLLVTQPDRLRFSPWWTGSRKVFLVGNRRQISREIAAELRKQDLDVVRVAGPSRYATAVKVARLIERRRRGDAPGTLMLADGRRLHDSLAAPAAAGRTGGAVLFTRGGSLPPATRRYLAERRGAVVYAVGRQAAAAMPGLPARRKVFGPNRYATAVSVAHKFFPEPTSAVFASGVEYVDAMLASSCSAHEGHPLLLLRRDSVPRAVAKYLQVHDGKLDDSLLVGDVRGVDESAFDRTLRLLDRN